ncbi:diguanylate cyclase [Massilia sp. PWRC2]|uniref:GGDEF domain-containing protein n=1 Tax=Massilia sp. PWRC2 TaxID=2804626 RepID=UPI003CEA8E67
MKTPRRSRPRSAVALASVFLLLVCLSLSAVQGWSIYRARQEALADASIAAGNMARAMADHADGLFAQVDSVLAGAVEQIDHGGLAGDSARLRAYLVMMVGRTAALQGLFIYDANGSWLANSLPGSTALAGTAPAPPMNNADRAYFLYHRQHADLATRVGAPVRSRSSGAWIIPVSRRLQHADGTFAGVVLATIGHDYFRNYYERFEIGSAGVIALAGDDGVLLMRRPFDARQLEAGAAAETLFWRWQAQGRSAIPVSITDSDGVQRRYYYEHLRDYPLVVGVGLSSGDVLESWRRAAFFGAAGTAALLAALLIPGGAMIGQLKRRERLQAELRSAKRELEASNARLQQMALSDGLTALPNRRHFDQRLEHEFKRAVRDGSALALIMLDVDYFKRYNDQHGHVEGDAALQQVAGAIGASLRRAADLGARFGGEEFVILLPDTDLDGALAVAEAVRAQLAGRAIGHRASPFGSITVSAGVAVMQPGRLQSARLLVEAADQALYDAKAAGRNRAAAAPAL